MAAKKRTTKRATKRAAKKDRRKRIGVVDTTFARVDMGAVALATLAEEQCPAFVARVTVPGVKDLPAAARRFLDHGFDAVIACGWVGPENIDKTCGHEASMGLMHLRVLFGRPVLEVFVHEDEAEDAKTLAFVARERTREHAINAMLLLYDPDQLVGLAGTGQRQGFEDAGPLEE